MMRPSDTAGARACASTARIPWDGELPADLWRVVLRHLSLWQLRLLKTVSHSMANRCRRVLRSKEWQAWAINDVALQAEVATQATRSYALPMAVRFLEDCLTEAPLLGTIHRLKLTLVRRKKNDFTPVDSLVASNWSLFNLDRNAHGYDLHVVDMLIEVHGYGLCGSEYALRRVLADVVLEKHRFKHGEAAQAQLASELCSLQISQDLHEDGTPSCCDYDEDGTQTPLWGLLQQIGPVTNVGGKDDWCMHRLTHQNEHGRNMTYIDLLHLCANCPGLLT